MKNNISNNQELLEQSANQPADRESGDKGLKGWREIELGNVAEIIMGQSPPGETYNEICNGFPFYQGVADFGYRYPQKRVYCTSPTRFANPGDILFSVRAPIGRINIATEKCAIGRGLACIRSKDISDQKFLEFVLRSKKDEWIVLESQGSIFGNAKKDDLIQLPISWPDSQNIRQAIAAVLSSLDDKIDLLHRQNKTLEAMAETLFRQWFVEPCKNGLPEGWEEGDISQLISIQNGYAFKSKDFINNGINRVIKIKNISNGIVDIINTDFIDATIANQISHQFKINAGDILIAMTGAEIGKLGIVPPTNSVLWLNQRVGLLKEKYPGSKYLAYLQLKSEFGQDHIFNTATGSAQANISAEGIEKCFFPKISEKEILEKSKEIEKLYKKIIYNLGQIHTLEKLRDLLLPKLISGEIRVRYE